MGRTMSIEIIEQKIFMTRGQKVMLSSYLAGLYEAEPKVLIQVVKRNTEKFPYRYNESVCKIKENYF